MIALQRLQVPLSPPQGIFFLCQQVLHESSISRHLLHSLCKGNVDLQPLHYVHEPCKLSFFILL
ncbi:hypothetical protein Fmac_021134 [Flemingia macrophylla]|uniref:Uncharacterized protein n=1 Tax=Flemingia macrophylla TaxID=520843 RepID=A0ABD1LW87_9FABA